MAMKRFRLPRQVNADEADEIRRELVQLPGVGSANVTSGHDLVSAEVDDGLVSDDELLAAIGRAGIEAELV
jgi:hypothetical protein